MNGGVPVRDLAERLDTPIPNAQGTVSSWLLDRFGRVPKPNEVYRSDGLEITVRRTRRGRVFEAAARVVHSSASTWSASQAP